MDAPPDPTAERRRRQSAACLDVLLLLVLARVCLGGTLRERAHEPPTPSPLAVDLTRAGVEALRLLPGIGDSRARAIVADRRHRGPIPHLDALVRVPGIGKGIVQGLRRARGVRAVVGTPVE